MSNKYCNLDGTKKIKNEYTKINNGFAGVEADRVAHINGTSDKHAAQHITYSGDQTGANVKDAIDNCKKDINNISMTGSDHDALVTAALVDEEGTDFGPEGEGTYLDGRLKKWEQRAKTHEADYTAHLLKNALTLYVDGASGDDANDGLTAQTAKKTIQAAVNSVSILVVAPVIIDIAEGTYNEAVVLKSLALDNITFQGKKDGTDIPTVILDGTGLGSGKSGITASFSMTTVYINDIKAQNYSIAGFEAAYGVYMNVLNGHMYNNGVEGFRVYHATGSLDNCLIDGNNVSGAYGAIAFHAYMSITNTEIKNTASYGGYYANHSDGHFDNNNIHDCFAGLVAKIQSFAQTKGTTFDTCTTGIFYDTGSDALWEVATTTFTNCTTNVDCNNIYRFMLGTTAQRPALGTGTVAGQTFYDLTLNKPIWVNKNNNGWVDGAGTVV